MLENIILDYYKKRYKHESIEVKFERVLKNFSGTNFKDLIEEARRLYNSGQYESYALYKGELPAVTFSGTFNKKREAASLAKYSGLIVLDLDKIGDDINSIKMRLFEDMHVLAIWLSPSGDGLKFLIKTDCIAEDHKNVYYNAVDYFTNLYQINIDRSGSDVSRLCYISYDKDLKFKEGFTTYDNNEAPKKLLKKAKVSVSDSGQDVQLVDRVSHNQASQKKILRRIYQFLKKRNLSITDTYENWIKVAYAISNTFSYEVGRRLFLELCQLDGSNHDEDASEKLILTCYRKGLILSSFKSIMFLAQTKGYDFNFKTNNKPNK